MSAEPGFDVFTRTNTPFPASRARQKEGFQAVGAEPRVHGDGVCAGHVQVSHGVGLRAAADVAALGIGDDQIAQRVRSVHQFLVQTEPTGTQRLVEGELRFDRHRLRLDFDQQAKQEFAVRLDAPLDAVVVVQRLVFVAQGRRQQRIVGIKPEDDVRTLPLDGGEQAIGEVFHQCLSATPPPRREACRNDQARRSDPECERAATRRPVTPHGGQVDYRTAFLRAVPALNFGTLVAAIWILALVCGLIPSRASRAWT